MRLADADQLIESGYLPLESGFQELEDGKWVVAALTRMPGCRAKVIDWWFSWLGDIEWYRLWHPTDHVYSGWEGRENGRYIGASHIVEEYFGGRDRPALRRRITFHAPEETFDAAKYASSGHFAICARNGPLDGPVSTAACAISSGTPTMAARCARASGSARSPRAIPRSKFPRARRASFGADISTKRSRAVCTSIAPRRWAISRSFCRRSTAA